MRLTAPILRDGPFHNVPAVVSTTVSIRPSPDEQPRKVTKIIGYRAGGLGLLAPYHSAKAGLLTKTRCDYRKRRQQLTLEGQEAFTAGDRVKLSYHPDGFVQFSGERPGRIVSGRDPETGEPRGLGIVTNPMAAPVMTGPAFGLALWGLQDFAALQASPRGDSVVFDESDFFYEHCDASSWGAYHLSFFIFNIYFQPHARKLGPSTFELRLWHSQYLGKGREFVMKVVRLGQQPFFLGAICSRIPPPRLDAVSGWILNGPGELSPGAVKRVLHAHYPIPWSPEDAGALDFSSHVDTETSDDGFVVDFAARAARSERESVHRASRELESLSLLARATNLLSEVMDGFMVLPSDRETPAGRIRIAIALLSTLALRTAHACRVTVAAGYVPEAGALRARLTLAQWRAVRIASDRTGREASRFLAGRGAPRHAQSEDDAKASIGLIAEILDDLQLVPEVTTVGGPDGPRQGLPIDAQLTATTADPLVLATAADVANVARIAAVARFPEGIGESLTHRLDGLRQELDGHT